MMRTYGGRDRPGMLKHETVPRMVRKVDYRSGPKFSDGRVVGKQCRPSLEQSDQDLHCLPFHLHLLDTLLYSKTPLFKF